MEENKRQLTQTKKNHKEKAKKSDKQEANQLALAGIASIIVGGLLSLWKLASDKKSK